MLLLKTWNFPGKTNMALDVVLAENVKEPLLRLYTWARPTLSLGRHQKRVSLNLNYMEQAGIECVMRPTGGRAVLHWDELTYTVVVPAPHEFMKKSLQQFHLMVSERIAEALKNLGFSVSIESRKKSLAESPACFEVTSTYELSLNGKKIVGSAQMRTKDFILEHGSILLRSHFEEYARCLNLKPEDLKDKFTGLQEISDVSFEKLVESLIESFSKVFGPVEHFKLNQALLDQVYKREGQFVCPVN
ncbi:biotin/lipoate A/B protein ligase family protein [Pseudothermotoga sp.]|uniref:lipoate--protein ligase family protein n=1 Tax=Pseudothermotoga sp. TaxID=2033661 RepID=UPI0031F658C0